jgi:hypothetical protein
MYADEKAKELISKLGKNKAIICTKEIIKAMEIVQEFNPQILPFTEYWYEVLNQIEK